MMPSSKTKSSEAYFQRSSSPSARFCSSTMSSSSSALASMTRSASPTRISLRGGYLSSCSSVRFSIDHADTSPGRSVASSSPRNRNNQNDGNKAWSNGRKKTCMCSPTMHPGSFRCSLHKNACARNSKGDHKKASHSLYARRSAMTNSLVRIGTVEGDLVQRALAALIRPSSHQQRRRGDFQPRPSRLSIVSNAED